MRALARGLARRRRDLEDALNADLVYLHLEAAPVGPPWIERRIARAGVPIVYDIDDLVHLPHGSRANPFMRMLRGTRKVPELLHPDWMAGPCDLPGYNPLWNIEKGFKDAVNWYASRGLLTSNG